MFATHTSDINILETCEVRMLKPLVNYACVEGGPMVNSWYMHVSFFHQYPFQNNVCYDILLAVYQVVLSQMYVALHTCAVLCYDAFSYSNLYLCMH